jgi:hypothetical protein
VNFGTGLPVVTTNVDTQATNGSGLGFGRILRVIGPVLGAIGAVIGIYNFLQSHPRYDLSGEWRITNTIQSTSYHPFQGLNLNYRVFLMQRGEEITGRGEKWAENERLLPPIGHTSITITGRISGKRISATFEEEGTRRKSAGTFDWTYEPKTNALKGTFTSTAANASGPSVGKRGAQ